MASNVMHYSHMKPALRSAADVTPFGMLAARSATIGTSDHRGGPALERMESMKHLRNLRGVDLVRRILLWFSSAFGPKAGLTLQPCRREPSAAVNLNRI